MYRLHDNDKAFAAKPEVYENLVEASAKYRETMLAPLQDAMGIIYKLTDCRHDLWFPLLCHARQNVIVLSSSDDDDADDSQLPDRDEVRRDRTVAPRQSRAWATLPRLPDCISTFPSIYCCNLDVFGQCVHRLLDQQNEVCSTHWLPSFPFSYTTPYPIIIQSLHRIVCTVGGMAEDFFNGSIKLQTPNFLIAQAAAAKGDRDIPAAAQNAEKVTTSRFVDAFFSSS